MVTIVIPVSRPDFLQRIFAALDMMNCKADETNLLVYVDGDMTLFEKAHNFVVNAKFKERLCVFRKKGLPPYNHIAGRRRRIGQIHNEIKEIVTSKAEYIFLIEDDTLLPLNALEKLLKLYTIYPHAGFITGVQVGRWGMNVPGIWKVDNPYSVNKVESQLPPFYDGGMPNYFEEIDAAGLYCCLTKLANYKSVNFEPFDSILGPDVTFGLELRKQGYKNYVDWSISTSHLTKKEPITLNNVKLQRTIFIRKNENEWQQELL